MNVQENKGSRTTRFLVGSFCMLLILSVTAFFCLGYYMSNVTRKSIDEMGDMYMTGISEQISSHFSTLIELKLEQVETAQKVVDFETQDVEAFYNELIYRVTVRGFDYLALCAEDGHMEMLYGEQIQLADPEPFFASLRNKQQKVAVGKDQSGREVILFGVNVVYPMRNGQDSMAMVAAVPLEYVSSMLETEKENGLMYSNIIRVDGTFIVNGMNEDYDNYFESLYSRYQDENKEEIDRYIQELSDAMQKGEDYSAILGFGDSRQQVYCTLLPYSEWHLITILPFGALNETVEGMSRSRTTATVLICMVIIGALLFIFYTYYQMTKQQML